MSFLHLAYVALIAAIIALRLVAGGAPVSASDRARSMAGSGDLAAARIDLAAEEAAPLITGRSVAVSRPAPDKAGTRQGLHDGIGAAGFARR